VAVYRRQARSGKHWLGHDQERPGEQVLPGLVIAKPKMVPEQSVGFRYLTRVENEKLEYGAYRSDQLICRLAKTLDADAEALVFLAKRIPAQMKRRILERPDAFRKLTELNDKALDRVLADLSDG